MFYICCILIILEYFENKGGGEWMNISGFSPTSPKIQFRAPRSLRGGRIHILVTWQTTFSELR